MNQREEFVNELLRMKGATVLNNGWPDFFVFFEDLIAVVEVKSPLDTVRPVQRRVHDVLFQAGISVVVVVVDKGEVKLREVRVGQKKDVRGLKLLLGWTPPEEIPPTDRIRRRRVQLRTTNGDPDPVGEMLLRQRGLLNPDGTATLEGVKFLEELSSRPSRWTMSDEDIDKELEYLKIKEQLEDLDARA